MPGRPLSEIKQMSRQHNRTESGDDEDNTNDTDCSADETEPSIPL